MREKYALIVVRGQIRRISRKVVTGIIFFIFIIAGLSVQFFSNPDSFIHDQWYALVIAGLQLRSNTIIVIAVGGAIAGLGLGVAGVRQKHRRRTIAVCGLIANSLFLGIVAVIVGLST